MEIGAFFDLDGTIMDGNSGLRFISFLYKNKSLKAKKSAILPSLKLAFSYLRGNYLDAVDQADDLMALAFKGADKNKILSHAEFFAISELKRIDKKMADKIMWHKSLGHKLILLSASPDDYIKKMGILLKFDYAIGSRFKSKKGIYTGKLIHPSMIGKERAAIAKKIAKKLKINLKESYAYGNCLNDLQVLELVKHPNAVRPNRRLAPVARKKGFRII